MRIRRALLPGVVLGAFCVAGLVTSPTLPASAAAKAVICHRTHSTTNPYRRITVSVSAINGSSTNDHTHHTGSPFAPGFDYPANAKNWGDVIPDKNAGGAGTGLNWDAVGQAIYNGTSTGGKSYAGTCGAMTAQQFYDVERAAGRTDVEIRADLDEQGADEDAAILRVIGSFSSPTGSSPDFTSTTTTTTAAATTTTVAITTTTVAAVTTTVAPTSVAPTTVAPTTVAPTTGPPTTVAPTTDPPTTVAPTTAPPTTVAPTTAPPTTVAPTTVPPTTEPPTTATPTTEPPVTVSPSTEPPTSATPTTSAPTTEPPTSIPTSSTLAPTTTTVSISTTTTVTNTGATVEGVAWFDLDHDDDLDPGEPRLPGVPVRLVPASQAGVALRSTLVRSGTLRTSSDGSYRFTGLQPGDYLVTGTVTANGIGRTWDTDGRADWTVSLHVPAESVARADMAAVGHGTLTGVVRTGSGAIVPDASITCTWSGLDGVMGGNPSDDVTFTTTADADGAFGLHPVPYGAFDCVATDAAGSRRSAIQGAVVSDTAGTATLVLGPSSSGPLPATGGGVGASLSAAITAFLLGASTLVAVRRPRRT